MTTTRDAHTSSVGHVLSSAPWLDAHFESCRAEYESMLAFADFEPGTRVLDAGCGSGAFLPLLVGAGVVDLVALDTAPEHLRAIGSYEGEGIAGTVCASIVHLPFGDATLDGVWCANTLQYLVDEQASEALSEFARVTRPGGMVAVKDVDMTAFKVAPAPPFLGPHLAEACAGAAGASAQSRGSLRGRTLTGFLQAAGMTEVRQRAFVIERFGPLGGTDAGFWSEWLTYLAAIALDHDLPEEDLETWRGLSTREQAEAFVARPDFYGCELQVVCGGRRPA